MRQRLLVLLPLAACRTVATDARTSTVPDAALVRPEPVLDAALAPASEAPLAWGTRPAREGRFFPVVDGVCTRGEVWPTGMSALFSYGRATLVRLTDEGVEPLPKETWAAPHPTRVLGSWPGPLVVYGTSPGQGRLRSYESLWLHEAAAPWSRLGSYQEKGEPSYVAPAIHGGWVITGRSQVADKREHAASPEMDEGWSAHLIVAYPLEKGAPPISNIAQLGRAGFFMSSIEASETAVYALGSSRSATSFRPVLRWLRDGKVGEVGVPESARPFGTTRTALYLRDDTHAYRVEDGKLVPLPVKLAPGVALTGGGVTADGDVWLLSSKDVVIVLHGDDAKELALPAPAKALPVEKVVRSPIAGALLAGVAEGDPYAIAQSGALFHFADGKWAEVPLPAPPFARTGQYKAQALQVAAKGDVYVNAAYVESGESWKKTMGYRAILRTKRPREVLRCNEPADENMGTADDLMSFPPVADAACKTPFVVLLRTAFQIGAEYPQYVFDGKSDWPPLRAAIKGLTSLGEKIELVEIASGRQRYVGAKVSTLALGQELARAVATKTKSEFHTPRPEVVCGTPKEERVVRVDVATGDVVP